MFLSSALLAETFFDVGASAPVAICVIEMPSQRYVFANDTYCSVLKSDIQPETIKGKTVFEILKAPHAQALYALEVAHCENRATRLDNLKSECMSREGSHWTGVTLPVFREEGKTFVLALLVEATSSVVKAERAHHQAMTAMAVHELRTPLTSLKILSALARKHLALGEYGEIEKLLDRLDQQSDSLARLIGDLHEMSNVSVGKITLDLNPERIFAELHDCVGEFVRVTDTHPIHVEIDKKSEATAMVDMARLDQVVLNLLGNAVKYSPSGSSITVSSIEKASSVGVLIADQGIGIAPANLERIFERFYQVPQERRYGGLGLGLYLARDIVQRMGGKIWAESSGLKKGSNFYIEFPKVAR